MSIRDSIRSKSVSNKAIALDCRIGDSPFFARLLSAREAIDFSKSIEADKEDNLNAIVRLLGMALVNPDGSPVYKNDTEAKELESVSLADLLPLYVEVARINKMRPEDLQSEKKA